MLLYKSLLFFIVLLVWSSSVLAFRYSFFMFLKCLLASRLTLCILYTLLRFGSCNHCTFACFLWSKNLYHSSSQHGLSCCNSYTPIIYFARVLKFCLMFSQALFLFWLQLKFSKAAKLFDILTWYCFLTSNSLSFLRLSLFTSNFCVACLFTHSFP